MTPLTSGLLSAEQPIAGARTAIESATEVKSTLATESGPRPPSSGWFSSASPWMSSAETLRFDAHWPTSREPATAPTAMKRSDSQASRSAMIAPFE